ncbi:hypothetical protein HHI36_015974 [Cryptolaemus montrouzieri]|uniref:Solute-binding protein family 3/N-terminal domain-containing protein n=1 Tax=Cryptolaemus montrouzieri TaxID=559131 RepID=A0ABD2N7I3_9CUCU
MRILLSFYIFKAILYDFSTGQILAYISIHENAEINVGSLERITSCTNNISKVFQEKKYEKFLVADNKIKYKSDSLILCSNFNNEPYSMLSKSGEAYGVEVDILEMIADSLGISVKQKYIKHWPNMTDYIVNNQCDVVYGNKGRWRCDTRRYTQDYTRMYLFERMYWMVPTPDFMPRYKYYLQAFTEEVWFFWTISSASICLVWYVIDRVLYSKKGFYELTKKFVCELRLLTEQNYEYERANITQTIISILMMFLTFTWNQFYKTRFQYFLTGLNYQDSIDTIDDIMKHRLKIGALTQTLHLLDHFPKDYVRTYLQVCDVSENCINRTAFQKDMAVLRPIIRVRYERHLHLDENKKWLVKQIFPHALAFQICAVFKAGHPLFSTMNRYISYMLESGLTDFIKSKYDNIAEGETPFLETQKLNFDHIYAPVCLLLFGLGMSCIVFLFETWFKYINTWCCKLIGKARN